MAEVFLSAGLCSSELTELLAEAVRGQREDLVRILIDHGADVRTPPFEDTLYEWHPDVIRLFLKHGADFRTGSPFAQAFIGKRRTALGIFKELLEKDPSIIAQANEALVHHIREGNQKWISLMLWLGPDARAPALDSDEIESAKTALREAAFYGRLEVLKKARLDPGKDDIVELLAAASFYRDPQVVEYLMSFSPDLAKPISDGETVMDSFFRSLGWDWDPIFMRRDSSPTIQCIEKLAKHGARWQPKERYRYSLRRALCRVEKWRALDVLNKPLAAEAFGDGVFRAVRRGHCHSAQRHRGRAWSDRCARWSDRGDAPATPRCSGAPRLLQVGSSLDLLKLGLLKLWWVVRCRADDAADFVPEVSLCLLDLLD
jgi:hypothetical protein